MTRRKFAAPLLAGAAPIPAILTARGARARRGRSR